MKKLLIILFSLFAMQLFAQGTYEVVYTRSSGKTKQPQPIYWYYAYREATAEYYSAYADTMHLCTEDSVYSCIYPIEGNCSISFQTDHVTTTSWRFIVQTANRSTNSYYDIPDSNWVDSYWVHYAGTGLDSCYIETVQDSITTELVKTVSIDVPILGFDAVRFFAYSTAKHDEEMVFYGQIVRTED